jgi:heat shock protein HslJ
MKSVQSAIVCLCVAASLMLPALCCHGSEHLLGGERWYLESYGLVGSPSIVGASDAPSVEFSADLDQIRGHVGCVCFGAAVTIDEPKIKLSCVWSTSSYCGSGQSANPYWFLAALGDAESYALQDDRLLIHYDGGSHCLTFRNDRAEELAGTGWILESYGPANSPTPPLPDTLITLSFSDDLAEVHGGSGCNLYGREVTLTGRAIEWGVSLSTMMYCSPDPIMDQEHAYVSALASSDRYDLVDDQLILFYGGGSERLVYALDRSKQLASTNWILESYGSADAPSAPLPDTVITLGFSDDVARAYGGSGCNLYECAVTLSGSEIQCGLVMSTLMYCFPGSVMEQEHAYTAALSSSERYELHDDTLILYYDGGGKRLVFTQDRSRELAGTDWILESYGSSVSPTPPLPDTLITLAFSDDLAKAYGGSGCNLYGYDVTLTGSAIAWGIGQTTMMACFPDPIMSQENAYLSALSSSDRYELLDDRLILYYSGGGGCLVYTRNRSSELAGTEWVLEWYGPAAMPTAPLADTRVTLRFSDDLDEAGGGSGCNLYGYDVTLTGSAIEWGFGFQTMMFCYPHAIMDQEHAYLDALTSSDRYELAGDRLILSYDCESRQLAFRKDNAVALAGTRWILDSYGSAATPTRAFSPPILMEDDARIAIAFPHEPQAAGVTTDYLVTAHAVCYDYEVPVHLGQETIAVDPPSIWPTACDAAKYHARDEAFLKGLLAAERYRLVNGKLVIDYHDGCDRLTFRPDPAIELAGTTWILDAYGPIGVPTPATPALGGAYPTLSFDQDLKEVTGDFGCNGFWGKVRAVGERVSFYEISHTLMWCAPAATMEQEATYQAALGSADSYRLEDGKLMIQYVADGQICELILSPSL